MNAPSKPVKVVALAPTLVTVIEAVRAAPGISKRHRDNIVDAIETVARGIGLDPSAIHTEPVPLRQRIDLVQRRAVSLTPARWRAMVQLLDDGLALAGLPQMPTRVQETVTPSWKAVLDQIESRYQRSHLRRLAIFCGSRQIAPDEVDDAVSGAYRGHLEASLIDRPKQVHRDAVLTWNIAVETVQGWPQIVLTPPENRGETSLPLSAFAPSFRLDVEAYLHHLSGKDLLTAAAKKVTRASPVTLRNRTVEIRRAATELVRAGHDPLAITKLADLVAKPAAECLLNRMWECNGSQPSGQAYNVARTLLAIARHWVKADTSDVENLLILCRALKPPRTGLTDKNSERLQHFFNPRNVRLLVTLPDRLLEEARLRPKTVSGAAAVQVAVAVAILLNVPMREKNLAELHLTKNLILSPAHGDGVTHVSIPEWRTKNHKALHAILPPSVTELIRLYLREYRPLLADASSPWLFPNRSGGHKRPSALAQEFPKAIEAATGLVVNLHFFRHFAAYMFLKRHPGEYEPVRQMLGHKSIRTTIEFYTGLEASGTFERYDDILDEYRKAQEDDGDE